MNFGSKATDALRKQQPTYLVAPNFTTRPFPDGPFDLGTLVDDIKQFWPINQGATNRVPIPEGQRYTDIKEDVTASLKTSLSGEASILAKILDRSIGGDASLEGQTKDEDVYTIQKLGTVYFHPQPGYIKKCLQLWDVKNYNQMANYKEPVYLITGLKIAWGATISTERDREFSGKAEGGVQAQGGPVDIQVKAQAGMSSESGIVSSFGKPADFVLAIQVLKIYHKKPLFGGELALKTKRVVKNATLVDDDDDDAGAEAEDEDIEFTIAKLDEEVEGLVPCTGSNIDGDDEIWLLAPDAIPENIK